jgi:phage tail-like protein
MNANQQRFWMLADERDWRLPAASGLTYDANRRTLRLVSQRVLPPPSDPASDVGEALSRIELTPSARDQFGARACWDSSAQAISATGVLPEPVEVYRATPGARITDLTMGYDGVLYVAIDDRVMLQDCRGRWPNVFLELSGFAAWRLASDPQGGVWVLDRVKPALAKVQGLPFPARPYGEYSASTFRPCEENPNPPKISIVSKAAWSASEIPVGVACSPGGRLAVLNRRANQDAVVRYLHETGAFSEPTVLLGARNPYSFAWVNETEIAILLPNLDVLRMDLSDILAPKQIVNRLRNPSDPLGVHLLGRFSAPGREMVEQHDLEQSASPLLVNALAEEFDRLLTGPSIFENAAFQFVRLSQETIALRAQNPSGGLLFRLNRMLLSDAFPRQITACPVPEALVYPISEDARPASPSGAFYPAPQHDGGPFVHVLSFPAHFPAFEETRPLHKMSLPAFAERGATGLSQRFDGGAAGTEWDRLYLEADIPPNSGIRVWLAATEVDLAPDLAQETAWHPHDFGEPNLENGPRPDIPVGAKLSHPSEIPHHPGLLTMTSRSSRAGLFTVLIQRAGLRVRTLRGRYLWVRIEMSGDARVTPEIAALRAYAPRFSYLNHYLPELYRETEFGPKRNERAQSTGPDFLERFLDTFEAVLTPLEDRIANSYLLTTAQGVPEDSIEWLGSWIGLAGSPGLTAAVRREMLAAAPHLFAFRGTQFGLRLALELVTGGRLRETVLDWPDTRVPVGGFTSADELIVKVHNGPRRTVIYGGAVTGGEIVVLEDFRLRRTFATILGADLEDETNPLLAGLSVSGNSFVGDTLFLGEEDKKEFLALFSADLPVSSSEAAAIASLFDQLAHRVTVLVHQEVDPQDLGLIRRIVQMETPAHIQARVLTATWPFLVGIASLVGVDTYLARKQPRQPVKLNRSRLGERDFLLRPASLDPRLGGGGGVTLLQPVPPVADPGEDQEVPFGESFNLDGSGSRAGPGRRIARYIWKKTE